jgi:hypothetical protein
MPSLYNCWVPVEGVFYHGNPVYYYSRTNDYAWEYCEHLVSLPQEIVAGLRSVVGGDA